MQMDVLGRRNSRCKGPEVRKLSMSEEASKTEKSWNKVSEEEKDLR